MRLCVTEPEDDDGIHNPDARLGSHIFSVRGIANLGCLILLLLCLLALLCVTFFLTGLGILVYNVPLVLVIL